MHPHYLIQSSRTLNQGRIVGLQLRKDKKWAASEESKPIFLPSSSAYSCRFWCSNKSGHEIIIKTCFDLEVHWAYTGIISTSYNENICVRKRLLDPDLGSSRVACSHGRNLWVYVFKSVRFRLLRAVFHHLLHQSGERKLLLSQSHCCRFGQNSVCLSLSPFHQTTQCFGGESSAKTITLHLEGDNVKARDLMRLRSKVEATVVGERWGVSHLLTTV